MATGVSGQGGMNAAFPAEQVASRQEIGDVTARHQVNEKWLFGLFVCTSNKNITWISLALFYLKNILSWALFNILNSN